MEKNMERKNMKKILASLGIASLISAGGMTLPSCATSGSGWSGDKEGADGADKVVEQPAGSGWSGTKDSAGSVENEEKLGDSDPSEIKDNTGSVDEETIVEKDSGDSGWSGSK